MELGNVVIPEIASVLAYEEVLTLTGRIKRFDHKTLRWIMSAEDGDTAIEDGSAEAMQRILDAYVCVVASGVGADDSVLAVFVTKEGNNSFVASLQDLHEIVELRKGLLDRVKDIPLEVSNARFVVYRRVPWEVQRNTDFSTGQDLLAFRTRLSAGYIPVENKEA